MRAGWLVRTPLSNVVFKLFWLFSKFSRAHEMGEIHRCAPHNFITIAALVSCGDYMVEYPQKTTEITDALYPTTEELALF